MRWRVPSSVRSSTAVKVTSSNISSPTNTPPVNRSDACADSGPASLAPCWKSLRSSWCREPRRRPCSPSCRQGEDSVPVPAKMPDAACSRGVAFGNRCFLLSNRRAGRRGPIRIRPDRPIPRPSPAPSYRRALVVCGDLPARTMGATGFHRPGHRHLARPDPQARARLSPFRLRSC
jgi:hypothetical protein